MLKKAKQTNTFGYKREDGQNPYIGFMSFQHFNGGKLYSDSIVRPENNYTETEPFECYPVPCGVEEKGREQGFYPDSSVAYIRALWKEFEPEEGVYNYEFIENIITEAKSHNQALIFRLMAHSTRECEDVPEWLKRLIPCPKRPEGQRVKDSPTDPLFLKHFCKAIRKIGERFDKDPNFYAIDISLPGAWGEGHNLHLYSEEALNEIVDTYLDVFKDTQLFTQVSRNAIISYANKTTTVGWRGDGLGQPRHTKELYPPHIEKVSDNWKKAPVSFESYWWLGEWKRQGWEIDEIIEKTLEWHISSFNAKSLPIPYEWKEKIDYWVSKMGYHFTLNYFKYPSVASAGDNLEFELGIENCGVAPIYKYIPFKMRIFNENDTFEFDTSVDIRTWMPGKAVEKITIKLPEELKASEYDIELGICNKEHPIIYFCTDAVRNGSFYKVGEFVLSNGYGKNNRQE
ncbi:MAG: DUF4832 domain-containing protein [Clostridia bacterium]|nr:DUF4832 domain-containing protein [Clostridia bacterium]